MSANHVSVEILLTGKTHSLVGRLPVPNNRKEVEICKVCWERENGSYAGKASPLCEELFDFTDSFYRVDAEITVP